MMKFLKFPSKEVFDEKCEEANLFLEDEEGEKVLQSQTTEYSIDIVGTIWTPGEYDVDEDGEMVETLAPVAHEGFHINMLGTVPDAFTDYLIEAPNTPHRVFFGY